jgi:HD-GYP domain-containing protein (c-di-GMP phosphodiesterase class II)
MDDLAPATQAQDPAPAHYLQAVTELGEKREVVTTEAIYSERGIKLVDVGVRIDRRMYERLVEFKLRQPIDRSLSVKGAVDAAALVAAATALLDGDRLDGRVAAAAADRRRLVRAFDAIPLPAPVAFRLTLMREQRSPLFDHSLQVALVSLSLGQAAGLDSHDLGRLAAAAVLHDLGMLLIDPQMLADRRPLTSVERRHLAAHPLTSMLIAREQGCYPATVLDAIVEHHERLDGTGYPQGRRTEQVSPLGRILMLAELASGICEKYGADAAQRLSIIVRLNHRKFDRVHSDHLLQMLGRGAKPATAGAEHDAARWVQRVGRAIERWHAQKAAVPAQMMRAGSAAAFIDMRLATLQRALHEAGYLLDGLDGLIADIGSETAGLVELAMLGQEAQWQIENTLHATRRRWPALAPDAFVDDDMAAQWCSWLEEQLAGGPG